MSSQINRQLTAINLRYGKTSKSLKSLAFGDLASKAMILLDHPSLISEITEKVAEIVGIKHLSEKFVEEGLKELHKDKKVIVKDNKWELTNEAKGIIHEEIEKYEKNLDEVLKRNFPQSIDEKKLIKWFADGVVDFFEFAGDDWVASVSSKGGDLMSRVNKSIEEILLPSIKKHSLEKDAPVLNNSFEGFLASSHKGDQSFFMEVGFAMFSSRLIASDIGHDPIVIDELKGSKFILDTNFLYAIQLDAPRFSQSFSMIGSMLQKINASLYYTSETEEEYKRVWVGIKGSILTLFKSYPEEIIFEMDDDFIQTAVSRGCRNRDDLESFFESIHNFPDKIPFSSLKIQKIEDKEIQKKINDGERDGALKIRLQNWAVKLRPAWRKREKSPSSLRHDSSLIHVAEFEREKNNAFILTLDKTLQACCVERVGNNNLPIAIHLEGLVHILAVNDGGPELCASDFAPLLTNMLIKRCVPPNGMYTAEDLHWLYSVQKNIATFKPEKIKQILLEVARARLSGKNADDESLQRLVNRLYQEEVQNTNEMVEATIARAQRAEDNAEQERGRRKKLEVKLKVIELKNEKKKLQRELIKTLLWRIPASVIFSLLVLIGSYYIFPKTNGKITDAISFGVPLIGSCIGLLRKPIQKFKERKEKINQELNLIAQQ